MKRKNHFVLFGVLLLALINLSPSSLPVTSNSGSHREPDEGATALRGGESERPLNDIEVYTMMGTEEFKALQAVNEEYERRSGAVVTLVNIAPEQAYKAYRDAYAAGREPDVLMLDGAWVADFAAAGRLLPADLYESGVAAASDSLPLPAASVEWNGYRWAVPLDFDPYGAVWNPDRFAATSGGLPQNGQAWQAWEQSLAAAPEDDSAGQEGGEVAPSAAIGLPAGDVRAFAALIALWKGSDEGEEEERVGHALQLADGLRARTYLPLMSASGGHSPTNLRAEVESGELALAVDRLSRLGAENGSASRVTPLSAAAQAVSLRCFGIAANTERSREASLWIAYITGQETQSDWYASTGHLPMLRAVYDDSAGAALTRWLPDPQAVRTVGEGVSADPKKTAAREQAWSRALDRFYEGRLGADGLAGYLLP